jgi:hypothetical protein
MQKTRLQKGPDTNKCAHAALEATKIERDHATTAAAVAAEAASAGDRDAADWREQVACLQQSRAGAVHAAEVARVRAVDRILAGAAVSAEIATARAATAHQRHASAVKALKQAVAAVDVAARTVLNGELLNLAAQFERALDHAMALGAKLQALAGSDVLNQPVNQPRLAIPAQAQAALARMPKVDDLHVSVDRLRGVAACGDGFAARLQALAA